MEPIRRPPLWKRFPGATALVLFAVVGITVQCTTCKTSPALGRQQGVSLSDTIPADPKDIIGKLPNGLTYYVRHNTKPEKRALLYLFVKTGSVLEDDDQQGFAHFAEHMAFNGTKNFAKQDMVNYMESIGMRFGPEVNAYTSYDETVYMLEVPTDSAQKLSTALKILYDWAGNVSFDSIEVEKERGVVTEEWRLWQGAYQRTLAKHLPVLLKGSKYAVRDPLGKLEIVQHGKQEALKRFYRQWYRPDLMAVMAVGDFDEKVIEAQIKTEFSKLPRHSNPAPLPIQKAPSHHETYFSIVEDKEATNNSISMAATRNKTPFESVADFRDHTVEALFQSMLNYRLFEISQATKPPIANGGAWAYEIAGNIQLQDLGAGVVDSAFKPALEALIIELNRARIHGFTQDEFGRASAAHLSRLEQSAKEMDKTESSTLIYGHMSHFTDGNRLSTYDWQYKTAQQLLPTIKLSEFRKVAKQWCSSRNRVIVASGPKKDGAKLPSEGELLAVVERASKIRPSPYTEKSLKQPLLSQIPAPGSIVKESTDAALGITYWTLSNGAKVALKPTDFQNDQILFKAYRAGGSSLYPDSDFVSAEKAGEAVFVGGLGNYSLVQLGKKLDGKAIQANPYIRSFGEGIDGSSSAKDVEAFFQVLYSLFQQPRFDSSAFINYKNQMKNALANRSNDPGTVFSDTADCVLSQYHLRYRPYTSVTFDRINFARSSQIYRDRFSKDVSGFTFYFTGSFKPEGLKLMILTYLASLPGKNEIEHAWKDDGMRLPQGIVQRSVYRGVDEKSTVYIQFHGPFQWNSDNNYMLWVLPDALQLRLRERVREELGGSYDVTVWAQPKRQPYDYYRICVYFGCDPKRVDELTKVVFAEIDSLRTHGVTEDYLKKVRAFHVESHKKALKDNSSWLNWMNYSDVFGDTLAQSIKGPEEFMKALTSQKLQKAAEQYFNMKHYARFLLYPEKMKPKK